MTDAKTLQASQSFEILTPRLRLRPMRMDDAKDLWQMRRRGEARKYDKGIVDTTIDVTQTWIQNKVMDADSVFNLVIELRNADAYIRTPPQWTGPTPQPAIESMEPSPERVDTLPQSVVGALGVFSGPEVGYSLHPAYQGRGYATEALKGFTEWYWTWWPRAPAATADESTEQAENINVNAKALDGKTALTEGDPYSSSSTLNSTDAAPAHTSTPTTTETSKTGNSTIETPTTSDLPPWPQLSDGTDYLQADTDPENYASGAVLRKAGFMPWSSTFDDFYSEMLGTRSTLMFRLARPGTELGTAPYHSRKQVVERKRKVKEGKWPGDV